MKIRTTPMRYAVVGPVAAIALTAASVSACGALGHPDGGPPSGSPTMNVCTLVPSSQVAAVAGEKVIQAIPEQLDSFPDPNSFLCTYYLSDGLNIQVDVEFTNSPDAFAANGRGLEAGGATPITSVYGVGDQAVASANGLAVLTDRDNILILDVPGELRGDHAGNIKLATILISALG
jgi:hypothetical protein